MRQLTFLVSLITKDNDYQREQAVAAEETARRLGAKLQFTYAENDAITQSQQILTAVQSPPGERPDGIVFEPAGTGLAQVAKAAAQVSVGWAVLNREVDYIAELRRGGRSAPIFSLSSDHEEVGRIQGRQMGALLPNGGLVLYIEGPSSGSAARQRTQGMYATRPANIQIRTIKGQWTEDSAYQAVNAWLRLSTSHEIPVVAVVAQNDSMAVGAKRALQAATTGAERERWMSLPFTGCDGVTQTGRAWVDSGLLAATVIVPPNTGTAMEMMAKAIETSTQPPEHSLTEPKSYPPLAKITPKRSAATFGCG